MFNSNMPESILIEQHRFIRVKNQISMHTISKIVLKCEISSLYRRYFKILKASFYSWILVFRNIKMAPNSVQCSLACFCVWQLFYELESRSWVDTISYPLLIGIKPITLHTHPQQYRVPMKCEAKSFYIYFLILLYVSIFIN